MREEDVYYIIFTSGSTGTLKEVQVTYGSPIHFVDWALTLENCDKKHQVYLNQAPFSLNLSVLDL